MPKKYITSLTGGLNEVTRADLIGDSEVQECVNYEISGLGILQKRTEPTQYSDSLNSLLNEVYNINSLNTLGAYGSVLFMSPPYYPPNKPSDMSGDFMLLFYGSPTPGNVGYAYYLAYESTRAAVVEWTYKTSTGVDLLESLKNGRLGLTFDQNNVPEVSIGENGIVLTDNINPPLNIYADSLGKVVAEKFTLNAPKNRPIIDIPTPATDDAEYIEHIYTDFFYFS